MKSLGSCGECRLSHPGAAGRPRGHWARSIVSNYHEAPSLGHSGHLVTYLARLPVADPRHSRTKRVCGAMRSEADEAVRLCYLWQHPAPIEPSGERG